MLARNFCFNNLICCIISSFNIFGNCITNNKNDQQMAVFVTNFHPVTKKASISSSNFDFLPTATAKAIVTHENFTLSYLEEFEQAEWVAYELKANKIKIKYKRPFFTVDLKVKTASADWRNYKKSGYDKGHLCPAADMKFSKKAFEDTFYTSNIAPQLPGFNNGVWNRLEQKTRFWADKYDGIYVVTGGVLKKGLKTIGSEKVAVPDYFYKVLLDESAGQFRMVAFLVPHKISDAPLYKFAVSVDSIEKITGIDFFPKLENKLENRLEKSASYKEWSFN